MLATKTSVAALLAAWDSAESPSAPITSAQRDAIDAISAKETDEAGTAEDITGRPRRIIDDTVTKFMSGQLVCMMVGESCRLPSCFPNGEWTYVFPRGRGEVGNGSDIGEDNCDAIGQIVLQNVNTGMHCICA